MKYIVRHLTRITYAQPVAGARFNLRLVPWTDWGPGDAQTLTRQTLRLSPEPAFRKELPGPYCVNTTRIGFEQPLARLEAISEFTVEVAAMANPVRSTIET